jgi:transcriptional regulator with XRE-family HTH domain
MGVSPPHRSVTRGLLIPTEGLCSVAVSERALTSAILSESARHPLVEARRTRGWSQETLAGLLRKRGLGTTRKTVTRWERGVVPDAPAQRALAEIFKVSDTARSQTAWPNWLPSIQFAGLDQPWDEAGTLEALAEVAERVNVDRRQFLALIGPQLLLPIYTWRLNPGPLLVYQAHGQQVSPGLVDELERLISVRRHMDDEHGGGALVNMLHSDLRFVTEMLKHGKYKEQVGQRLYSAAAELARLAGWAAFDSGQHAAAQQYYFAGIRAASALGDHALAVNIVGFLGIQAYSTGRLADAVQLMDVAAAESKKTPAIIQAMTWARTGRAYAKVGDKSTARTALNRSSEFLGKAISGDTPPWAYWVDETRLTAQIGRALFDLGDYKGAERDLTSAIVACQDKYPRDRATWQGRIAISQLRTDKLEEACISAQQTVDLLAGQVDSERAVGFLRIFKDDLIPFADTSTVRGFIEYAESRLNL